MKKYVCKVCGYVYDEAKGIPSAGIPAGTKFEQLPENWVCPVCGASKSMFKLVEDSEKKTSYKTAESVAGDMKELTALEMSAVCSNLARGCEKQYKAEEAGMFSELANYFKAASKPYENPDMSKLMALIDRDIEEGFGSAKEETLSQPKDRGALRALTWSEKVTLILKSLVERYEKEGDAMLENTGVYVCTICGFIYIGAQPPAICPVCKVPSWKFEKIEGRAL